MSETPVTEQKPPEPPYIDGAKNNAEWLGKSMLCIYGNLKSCRDSYNEAAKLFLELRQFDRRLLEVIKWSMPCELNRVEFSDALIDAMLTDEGFADALKDALAGKTNVHRMSALVQIAQRMKEGLADLNRKEAKLTERVKLAREHSPEYMVAVKKRGDIRNAVKVLGLRMADVASKFFKCRKRCLADIAKASGMMFRLYLKADGKYDDQFIVEMLKNSSAADAGALASLDASARHENCEVGKAKKPQKGVAK